MTLQIRHFEEKDIDQVIQINWTCLPENYSPSFFSDIFENFPKTFLVANFNEKIVGYIMCRIENGFSELKKFHITKKGHIISIAVLPEFREKGVGTVLLSEAIKNLEFYKAKECYLEVRTTNLTAIKLYKKFNFIYLRTMRGYYRDGESAYIMLKELPT